MPEASGGEEGRGKLRKAAGICKQETIRGYPNGATRRYERHLRRSKPGEPKHPSTRRRRKKNRFPQ